VLLSLKDKEEDIMILSSVGIQKYIESGEIVIDPFNKGMLKPASYIFTLDNTIRLLREEGGYDEVSIVDGYGLRPGGFVLASTKEHVRLGDRVGMFLGVRGSMARIGLNALQSSTFAEPGSDNKMILDLSNVVPGSIKLSPGMKIVTGVFVLLTDD